MLVLAPRSLHLGWTTAATLVNANAWAGYAHRGPSAALTAAILSIAAATIAATIYAWVGATSAAFAIAWALQALSKGLPVGPDAKALGPLAMNGLAQAEALAAKIIYAGLLGGWFASLTIAGRTDFIIDGVV